MAAISRHHFGLLACAVSWTMLAGVNSASAQPVIDLALSDAQLASRPGCAILKINFNIRIRYASHFPIAQGQELRITLNPIDRDQAIALRLLKREAIRVPDNKLAAIRAIDFETRQIGGPILRILFDHPVSYRVAQSSDIQSVIVAISGPTPSAACKAEYPAGVPGLRAVAVPADGSPTARPAGSDRPKDRPSGKISDADLRAAAATMDEARAALKKNNPGGAIQLFTKVLRYPENEYSAEAQEFLGLARQRSGQNEAAKAEYEDYLRRYPDRRGIRTCAPAARWDRYGGRRAGQRAPQLPQGCVRASSPTTSSQSRVRRLGRYRAAYRNSIFATTAFAPSGIPPWRRIRPMIRIPIRSTRTKCSPASI